MVSTGLNFNLYNQNKKMKQLITALLILVFTNTISAQLPNWNWAKGIGSSQDDIAMGTAVDAIGNIYTIGSFQGTNVSFGSILLSSNGDKDIFITVVRDK
jgi:hypothetical protein